MVRTQTAVGSGDPLVRRKIIDEGRLRAALFFAGNLRNPEPPLGRIAGSSPSGAVRPGRGAEINTVPIRKPDDGRTVLYAGSSHGNMRIFCFLFVVYAERNVANRIVFIRLFIIFVSNLTILGVMAKIKGTIVVDKERCKGCGVCASACPCDVLALSAEVNSKGYPVAWMVNPDSCTGCASCAVICPDSCITVYRQKFE